MKPISSIYGRKSATGLNWITFIAMTVYHIGAVAALFYIDSGAILAAAILWWITGSLGIGMAYHRLLTHRGYKCPKWVEYVLTTCGALALEGGPIFWVATHRIHHQLSDKEGDPHTPKEGAWWAHIGWIMFGQAMHHDTNILKRYVPDLSKDRYHVWLTTWHWIPQVVVGLALLAYGGLPYVLWGVFFRTTFGLHATWLVNSATHMWGYKNFRTRDDSTQPVVGGPAGLGRGLAQQPPRPSGVDASRSGVVRVRPELHPDQVAREARPGVGPQGGSHAQGRLGNRPAGIARRGRHLGRRPGGVGTPVV